MELHEFRQYFPSTEHQVYLNHAGCSPLPTPTFDAVRQTLEEQHLYGCRYVEGVDRIGPVRETAARFLGASVDEVALTRNTSHGLLLVANGLPWRSGDNVVTVQGEFPANVYPWMTLKRKGVEVRFAPQRSGRILAEDIEALVDAHTRLVAIGAIEFGTGFRNDLQAISAICRKHGVLLSVDATQALGQVPFDVNDPQVDFVSAGGVKWLMSPPGTGLFFCRKPLVEQLAPAFLGWRSTTEPDNYYSYEAPWLPTAQRFEEATLNVPGLLGLKASMELLLEAGLERIRAHLLALTDRLAEGLQKVGCRIATPMEHQSERSAIVCFQHPSASAQVVRQSLAEANVIVAVRGDVVRVSPHFYNTEDDIDALLSALP